VVGEPGRQADRAPAAHGRPEDLDRARAIATPPQDRRHREARLLERGVLLEGLAVLSNRPFRFSAPLEELAQEEVRESLRGASTALLDDAPELLAGLFRLSRALEGATQPEPCLSQGGVDHEGLAVLPLRLLHQVARRASDALPAQRPSGKALHS